MRHSDFVALFRDLSLEICSARVTTFNDLDDRKSTDCWRMLTMELREIYREQLRPDDVWVTDDFCAMLHADYRRYTCTDLSILL